MGNWNINIQGVGCHHNDNLPTDANRMAVEFVTKLREAGHVINSATFTYGGAEGIVHKNATDALYQSPHVPSMGDPKE